MGPIALILGITCGILSTHLNKFQAYIATSPLNAPERVVHICRLLHALDDFPSSTMATHLGRTELPDPPLPDELLGVPTDAKPAQVATEWAARAAGVADDEELLALLSWSAVVLMDEELARVYNRVFTRPLTKGWLWWRPRELVQGG